MDKQNMICPYNGILFSLKSNEGDGRGWDGVTDSMVMSLSKFWEMVKDREAWHAVIHGIAKN